MCGSLFRTWFKWVSDNSYQVILRSFTEKQCIPIENKTEVISGPNGM